jgi:hypothetical protein
MLQLMPRLKLQGLLLLGQALVVVVVHHAGDIAVNGGLKMVISMAGLYIIMAELLLL